MRRPPHRIGPGLYRSAKRARLDAAWLTLIAAAVTGIIVVAALALTDLIVR